MLVKLKGSDKIPTEVHEDCPDVNLIVEFLMKAEELVAGKHQTAVVDSVVMQFSNLILYTESLQDKLDNLRKAYSNSLRFTQALQRKSNTPESISGQE